MPSRHTTHTSCTRSLAGGRSGYQATPAGQAATSRAALLGGNASSSVGGGALPSHAPLRRRGPSAGPGAQQQALSPRDRGGPPPARAPRTSGPSSLVPPLGASGPSSSSSSHAAAPPGASIWGAAARPSNSTGPHLYKVRSAALAAHGQATEAPLTLVHRHSWVQASGAVSLPARLHRPAPPHPAPWGAPPQAAAPRTLPPLDAAHWPALQPHAGGAPAQLHPRDGDRRVRSGPSHASEGDPADPPVLLTGASRSWQGSGHAGLGSGAVGLGGHEPSGAGGRGLLSTSAPAQVVSSSSLLQAPSAQHQPHANRLLDSLVLGAGHASTHAATAAGRGGGAGAGAWSDAHQHAGAAAATRSSASVLAPLHAGSSRRSAAAPGGQAAQRGGALAGVTPTTTALPPIRPAVGAGGSKPHGTQARQQQQRSAAMAALSEALQLGAAGAATDSPHGPGAARR